MASEINIRSGAAFFTQNLSFLGQSLTLKLSYNSTDSGWRLSIYNKEGALLEGILLRSNSSPTKRYGLDSLEGGNFWVIRKTNTDQPLGFSNFGFDKDFGLFFLTTAEEESYGL